MKFFGISLSKLGWKIVHWAFIIYIVVAVLLMLVPHDMDHARWQHLYSIAAAAFGAWGTYPETKS